MKTNPASSFASVMGLAGVAPEESSSAIKWANKLEWPMVLIALWIIIEWYLEAKHQVSPYYVLITDWSVWGFFLIETCSLTYLVKNKLTYLKTNWVNLVIIFLGFPLLWHDSTTVAVLRSLRLLVMFSLLLQVSGTARRILSKNHLGTTLLIGFILIIFAGFLIAGIDPAIDTPWEGIWWAWVTVTTVGYGDLVPVSPVGRLFASVLILMGIAIFSLLTANFSAFFVSRDEKRVIQREERILAKLEQIEMRLNQIESEVKKNKATSEVKAQHRTPEK
jgi:voltage-gated potassium channel